MGWTWLYLIAYIIAFLLLVVAGINPPAIKTRALQGNLIAFGLAAVVLVWIIETARVLNG